MIKDALHPDAIDLIRDTVLGDMGRFGGTAVDVKVEPDHDGDPSLQIDISYSGEGEPVDPKVMAELHFKVRDRLWRFGEERFPYLRHRFPDHQKVLGFP